MDQTHRKIELQAPSDLQYLISNASLAARQKIDLHFPPPAIPTESNGASALDQNGVSEGIGAAAVTEDPMRRRVEELVQAFIERTFAGVKQNVSVNGLEGKEMEALLGEAVGEGRETEPFDHRLARRIQDVSSQIEALQLQLANLRRAAPSEAAGRHAAALEVEEERRRARALRLEEEEIVRTREVELDVKGLAEVQDMRRSWEQGTTKLIDIKQGIGGVVGKLEKAREGVVYLEGA